MNRAKRYIATSILLFTFVAAGPVAGQDYAQIDTWADQYCSAAKNFMQSLVATNELPERWDMSYAFVQQYQRTVDAADRALQTLRSIVLPARPEGIFGGLRAKLPSWADYYAEVERVRDMQLATIAALSNIRTATKEAIRDVENAVNQVHFSQASGKYKTKLQREIQNLESVTKRLSGRTRNRIGQCTVNLLRQP